MVDHDYHKKLAHFWNIKKINYINWNLKINHGKLFYCHYIFKKINGIFIFILMFFFYKSKKERKRKGKSKLNNILVLDNINLLPKKKKKFPFFMWNVKLPKGPFVFVKKSSGKIPREKNNHHGLKHPNRQI